MDQFLVHDNNKFGRAMHALVIGVGAYPHLLGGDGQLTDSHDGLRQLSSPPSSARAFANWLIGNFNNPSHPRHTISLLLSEASPEPYVNLETGTRHDVATANFQNIQNAVDDWVERGNEHIDDMLVLFFCGHGISNGQSMIILPSDYGSRTTNAFDTAIDFLALYDSLNQYQALNQWFFIDCCRAHADSLLKNEGRSIIQDRPRQADGIRIAPVFYSTLSGEYAYGESEAPSFYTDALVKCLDHHAADTDAHDERWLVNNYQLAEALQEIMNEMRNDDGVVRQFPHVTNIGGRYVFHYPKELPNTKLNIFIDPPTYFRHAKISVTNTEHPQIAFHRQPSEGHSWELTVPSGYYRVDAEIPNDSELCRTRVSLARPITRIIRMHLP